MPSPISGTTVYLMPGMSVKLKSSITNRNDFGWFIAKDLPVGYFENLEYSSREPLRGFVVEDTRNGDIAIATDEEAAAVIYTHKRPEENAIWFFSFSGERGLVNVISVPIHDHSSVVQGGPAYGTYFDDETQR